MTDQQEHIYIKKVLNGDANAFSFLVEKYQNMVFTMAVRMLNNREEAEDAAQEAFIKCYKSLSSFKGDAKFSTWMYKIVYHTCLDKLKQNRKNTAVEVIDDINEGGVGLLEDAFSYIEQQEKSAIINNAIAQLASDEQMIVTLYYFEELSLKEISEIVNISTDNVKIKLFRSRKKLFTLLKNRLEPSIEKL